MENDSGFKPHQFKVVDFFKNRKNLKNYYLVILSFLTICLYFFLQKSEFDKVDVLFTLGGPIIGFIYSFIWFSRDSVFLNILRPTALFAVSQVVGYVIYILSPKFDGAWAALLSSVLFPAIIASADIHFNFTKNGER